MQVDLLYGRGTLPVRLPDDVRVTVVGKHPMTPLGDPARAVREALGKPTGCPPLAEIARGMKSACI
ncbi:MAG: DUF2088 domain-containing protein, partial [Deltaproteobacteria bacterium]|nr:DUF2088 domain-containing protein [Deltaproteobacteria bacterium]